VFVVWLITVILLKTNENFGAPVVTDDFNYIPRGSELFANIRGAGMDVLGQEGLFQHTHQHVDLLIDDQKIIIPANLGIETGFISPIHTHEEQNIIHVESPVAKDFTLGQFFRVWGITFNNQCIGTYCVGNEKKLSTFVNGILMSDPANYVLKQHDEIEIWYGAMNQLPIMIKSYDFPAGL
jgi:hypothetical protein